MIDGIRPGDAGDNISRARGGDRGRPVRRDAGSPGGGSRRRDGGNFTITDVASSRTVVFQPQIFDGTQPEISQAEQDDVAKLFEKLFAGVYERHGDFIDVDADSQSIVLVHETEKQRINMLAHRQDDRQVIGLHMEDLAGSTVISSRDYRYERDAAGVARRFDLNTDTYKGVMQNEIESASGQEFAENLLALLEGRAEEHMRDKVWNALSADQPNFEMEEAMRLNNQPIGLKEMQQLQAIADRADIPMVTWTDLLTQTLYTMFKSKTEDAEGREQMIDEFTKIVDRYLSTHAGEIKTDNLRGDQWVEREIVDESGSYTLYVGRRDLDRERWTESTPFVRTHRQGIRDDGDLGTHDFEISLYSGPSKRELQAMEVTNPSRGPTLYKKRPVDSVIDVRSARNYLHTIDKTGQVKTIKKSPPSK